MYEHRSEPLLPLRHFWWRFGRHLAASLLVVAVALGIGTVGYHRSGFAWIDAGTHDSLLQAALTMERVRSLAGCFTIRSQS